METTFSPKNALKYDATVSAEGQVTLPVPFPPGARIVVFVIEEMLDIFDDLLSAAQSSLDFWDNPFDDEDWNNA